MIRASQKGQVARDTPSEPSPKSCILSIADDNVTHSSFSILVANLSGVQLEGTEQHQQPRPYYPTAAILQPAAIQRLHPHAYSYPDPPPLSRLRTTSSSSQPTHVQADRSPYNSSSLNPVTLSTSHLDLGTTEQSHLSAASRQASQFGGYWDHESVLGTVAERLSAAGSSRPSTPTVGQQEPQSQVAFVATDIEGSTALWEKAPAVMQKALEVHDQCLRMLLYDHCGHEVATEGDAFTCAFPSAQDAVLWCLHVQQALMTASWPEGLAQHRSSEERLVPDGCVGLESLVFRGLRVRMGVFTGSAYTTSLHPVTGQCIYRGRSVDLADTICNMGYGGQVLVCGTTYREIYSRLAALSKLHHHTHAVSSPQPASPLFDMHYPVCIPHSPDSTSDASDTSNPSPYAPPNTDSAPTRAPHASRLLASRTHRRQSVHITISHDASNPHDPPPAYPPPARHRSTHEAVTSSGPSPHPDAVSRQSSLSRAATDYSPWSHFIPADPPSPQPPASLNGPPSTAIPHRLWRRLSHIVATPMRRTRPSRELIAQLAQAGIPPGWTRSRAPHGGGGGGESSSDWMYRTGGTDSPSVWWPGSESDGGSPWAAPPEGLTPRTPGAGWKLDLEKVWEDICREGGPADEPEPMAPGGSSASCSSPRLRLTPRGSPALSPRGGAPGALLQRGLTDPLALMGRMAGGGAAGGRTSRSGRTRTPTGGARWC